jgi:carboxypeptidase C (cathepsin A)
MMMLENGWNLKGVAVGNGLVDPISQVEFFAPWTYAHGFSNMSQTQQLMEAEYTVCLEDVCVFFSFHLSKGSKSDNGEPIGGRF